MPMAQGTVEVRPGEETAYHEAAGQARLTHANGTQRFRGAIEGEGTIEWLMCYLPDGTARYVGLQYIDGAIEGRHGTIVMEATGVHDDTGSEASWKVIRGSGTGELIGLTGSGGFQAEGGRTVKYHLDYLFG